LLTGIWALETFGPSAILSIDDVPVLFQFPAMASLIDTLRKAVKHGMLLRIECRACGNAAHFLASDVAQFADASRPLSEIRFRCRTCNARDFSVTPQEHYTDRTREVIVWRPVKLK